ncbi:hypothetical protein AGMMS49975_00240 [Clostridia bacterium]|nr:hypothetical protein AGMMS49975_00240 [Clostridia bacterium]
MIAVLSNIGTDSLKIRLTKTKKELYIPDGYNVWLSEISDLSSEFYNLPISDCFVLLHGSAFDKELYEISAKYLETAISRRSDCRFYISDIDIPFEYSGNDKNTLLPVAQEYEWYLFISKICKEFQNARIFQLKELITAAGRDKCISAKLNYISGNPFTPMFEKIIISEIEREISMIARKKCLVLDMDNTLWGGVIGEVGYNGILLAETGIGAAYYDFQKKIKLLKETGTVLAICSKNNEEDALLAFDNRSMFLKRDDFVIIKANWKSKSENIKQIAEELNIGLDSIVFVDDNRIEREEVKINIPAICVADFPNDISGLPKFADELYRNYFYVAELTAEDKNKTRLYAENIKRDITRSEFNRLDDFVESLKIELIIRKACQNDVNRIYQLVTKTNQFNSTVQRYSEDEIEGFLNEPAFQTYVGRASDKFGGYGDIIIALVRTDGGNAKIETFLMSCRAMGRSIESAFLSEIVRQLNIQGYQNITFAYIPTKKNAVCREFLRKYGAESLGSDEFGELYSVKALFEKKYVEVKFE